MNATLLTCALALLATGDAPPKSPPRKPSAIAPSLPALTREEEDKIDAIVDRFILADTGRLRGAEARKAVKDLEALGPEAIPSLIRGLNKAAGFNHTCPVLVLSKKLTRMLLASDDQQLLEFARDEIGAGVGRTRYSGALQDLRFKCLMRKNALARRGPPPPRAPRSMTTSELARAAGAEKGSRLKQVLAELEQRRGKEVLAGLAAAAASADADSRKLGREWLDRHLARQSADLVKAALTDRQAEVRRAAARVAGAKHAELADYLIELLTDEQAEVRGEARQALVKLSRGEDHGPSAEATRAQQQEAQGKWRAWLARRGER